MLNTFDSIWRRATLNWIELRLTDWAPNSRTMITWPVFAVPLIDRCQFDRLDAVAPVCNGFALAIVAVSLVYCPILCEAVAVEVMSILCTCANEKIFKEKLELLSNWADFILNRWKMCFMQKRPTFAHAKQSGQMNHLERTSVEATAMEQLDDSHIRASFVAAIKVIDLCCIWKFSEKSMNLVISAE